MSLYQHSQTGEVREIDAELIAAWVAAGNPKAGVWQAYTPPPAPPADPAPVPASVTRRQLYRGLREVGWLGTTLEQIDAAIDAMLASMPEPPRETARIEFRTSRDFLSSNPMLLSALMSAPLSKTLAEVHDFFRLCASFAPEGEG